MDIWIISSFGLLQIKLREFPGCLVVRILGFHCRGPGLISGQGTEKLQAVRCGQNLKREGKKKRSRHYLCFEKQCLKNEANKTPQE